MPAMQYYCYVEITPRESIGALVQYEQVSEVVFRSFRPRQQMSRGEHLPVFRKLFQKRMAHDPATHLHRFSEWTLRA